MLKFPYMGRRRKVVMPELDSGDVKLLPPADVRAVIRAAEEVNGTGGRNIMTKILKGSRSKDVSRLGLDKNPVYGYFSGLTLVEVARRVDFVIQKGYAVLERGRCSAYSQAGEALVFDPLPGIKPRGILQKDVAAHVPAVASVEGALPDTLSPMYPLLAPESDCARKSLRTKRRRIHNYFGGAARMAEVSVTLSARRFNDGRHLLAGMRVRIAGLADGLKALDASERYMKVATDEVRDVFLLCFAQLILVKLEKVPCRVFFDSTVMDAPDIENPLVREFVKLDFVPTVKGPQIERLRRKLQDLMSKPTNEIVTESVPDLEFL